MKRFARLTFAVLLGATMACQQESAAGRASLEQEPATAGGTGYGEPAGTRTSVNAHPTPPMRTGTPVDPAVTTPAPVAAPLSEPLFLGEHKGGAPWATLSADGSMLVYTTSTSGLAAEVYARDLASGAIKQVSPEMVVVLPNAAPIVKADGSAILFRAAVGGGGSWHGMDELWHWDWESGTVSLVHATAYRAGYAFAGDTILFAEAASRDLHVLRPDKVGTFVVDTNVWIPQWDGAGLQVSPGGRYVAYVTGVTSTGSLKLIDLEADSLEPTLLAEGVDARSLRFGQNGVWLAWSQGEASRLQHRLADGTTLRLDDVTRPLRSPDWSGVAYLTDDRTPTELRYYSAVTGETTSVDPTAWPSLFAFSGDGQTLVYGSAMVWDDQNRLTGALWAMNLATGDKDLLTASFTTDPGDGLSAVAISHDGGTVSYRGPGGRAWLRRDGLTHQITDDESWSAPTWTADETSLVFWEPADGVVRYYDMEKEALTELAEDVGPMWTSQDAVHGFWKREGEKKFWWFTARNWLTGAQQTVSGQRLRILAQNNDHVVYATRDGSRYEMFQLELP